MPTDREEAEAPCIPGTADAANSGSTGDRDAALLYVEAWLACGAEARVVEVRAEEVCGRAEAWGTGEEGLGPADAPGAPGAGLAGCALELKPGAAAEAAAAV